MGVAQYNQGDYSSAVETFTDYLRRYATPRARAHWLQTGGGLRVLCYAKQQQYALAVQAMNQTLRMVPLGHPLRDGYELFVANNGSWIMTVTKPNKATCVLAAGSSWETMPLKVAMGPSV